MTSFYSFLSTSSIDEIRQYVEHWGASLVDLGETMMIAFNNETESEHDEISHLRGLIFETASRKILNLGFRVPHEFIQMPAKDRETVQQLAHYKVHECIEGTLIHVWYDTQHTRWMLSTRGCADAHKAEWCVGSSFGQLFDQAVDHTFNHQIDKFWNQLSPKYVYLFVLCHAHNTIVKYYEEPTVYHTATISRETLTEVDVTLEGVKCPQVYPEMTIADVITLIRESAGKPVTTVGYVVVQTETGDSLPQRYRFECANYTQARFLRGSTPNIDQRLLELYTGGALNEFVFYCPYYRNKIEGLLRNLDYACQGTYYWYKFRHIDRQQGLIPREVHWLVEKIHKEVYLPRPQGARGCITTADVGTYMLRLPVSSLMALSKWGCIKRLQAEQVTPPK